MNEKELRNIIREHLIKSLFEQEDVSPFTPAEEKFLAKFAEFETNSLGILYTNNLTGKREFLNRSGKDYNLTPEILNNLLNNNTISIVPYGGYSRNEDFTIQLNLPYDTFKGISDDSDDAAGDDAAAGADTPPVAEENIEKLAQNIVLEAKKSKKKKKKKKSKVHTSKSRALKRLPKGYVVYLEKIIQVLGEKVKNDMEKEHLVADILDNLSHNFGLTPKQVYRSYIYYKSQNRLANIIKDNND